jgi:hypothetical protein
VIFPKDSFAKQGDWNPAMWGPDGPNPEPRSGRIPNDSIWGGTSGGHFNYVVYFPSTRSYAWMDHWIGQGPQTAYVQDIPPELPAYPHTIWCSTCIRKGGKRK